MTGSIERRLTVAQASSPASRCGIRSRRAGCVALRAPFLSARKRCGKGVACNGKGALVAREAWGVAGGDACATGQASGAPATPLGQNDPSVPIRADRCITQCMQWRPPVAQASSPASCYGIRSRRAGRVALGVPVLSARKRCGRGIACNGKGALVAREAWGVAGGDACATVLLGAPATSVGQPGASDAMRTDARKTGYMCRLPMEQNSSPARRRQRPLPLRERVRGVAGIDLPITAFLIAHPPPGGDACATGRAA